MRKGNNKILLIVERTLFSAGAIALLVFLAAWVHARNGQQSDLAQFDAARLAQSTSQAPQPLSAAPQLSEVPETLPASNPSPLPRLPAEAKVANAGVNAAADPLTDPDQRQWSESAKQNWRETEGLDVAGPLGVLTIPKIDLRVAVLGDTDELTLNRGTGWINGTSAPGESGHIGIAGHRDSFFRGLKDIRVGDEILLETLQGVRSYEVSELLVVNADDHHVLAATANDRLTLVTCYPFYYVGSAPERWIVRAEPVTNDAG